MDKRYWKKRAKQAEAQTKAVEEQLFAQAAEVRALQSEVEHKRQHWAPIKITHPWIPRDAGCKFCDDPREDPRHVG